MASTIYGYAKGYMYDYNGQLLIKVRIPQIHGAYNQKDYQGQRIHNYVLDEDLPFYNSVVLPRLPNDGDVVSLDSSGALGAGYTVTGLTGGKYNDGVVDTGR